MNAYVFDWIWNSPSLPTRPCLLIFIQILHPSPFLTPPESIAKKDATRWMAQTHFLRIILDEGHLLQNSTQSLKVRNLLALRAQSRWIMTGTPTRVNKDGTVAALDKFFALVDFLRIPPYGERKTKLKKHQMAWHPMIRNIYVVFLLVNVHVMPFLCLEIIEYYFSLMLSERTSLSVMII